MSLASYQAALPRDEEKSWQLMGKQGFNAPFTILYKQGNPFVQNGKGGSSISRII